MNENGPAYLSPRLLQIVGVLLLLGSAVFWGATGRESVLLMSAAMSLIGIGAYRGAQEALTKIVAPKRKDKDE